MALFSIEQWDTLKELGLTDNEVAVFLALLETGPATAGPLVPKCRLHRSRIYAALERLVDKGLVSVIRKGRRHLHEALPPENLIAVLEERNKRFADLIPALSAMYVPARLEAGMYEGVRGVKAIRERLLSEMTPGQTLLVQGAPRVGNERLEAWFLDFHHRREARRVGMRILYNADAKEFGEKRRALSRTHVRYMREKTVTPAWIDIFPDSILIVVMSSRVVAFFIRDQGVRDSFAATFELLWKNATK